MAVDGMWTLTDEGEFVLCEPYKTQLVEAKLMATKGWRDNLLDYLEPRSIYDREFLNEELLRRNNEPGMTAMQILEEFVLETLGGDL